MSAARNARGLLLAAILIASASARAAEATPPAAAGQAQAPAPPATGAPPPPSQAAVAAADSILTDMGVRRTLALVVPGMLTELERNVTTTRPEVKDQLRDTLRAIQPDFDKSAQDMYAKATALMVTMLPEKDIEAVAAFFASSAGKKYLAAEPQFMQRFSALVGPWRDQMSTDIVTRARQEMKKKGIDF
ncbi:MAG: DUF2059 domain-containing protein [Hyphomicrobiales bacterium]|nr:DUF2059 domain-containing protein [Hyphomicrobiales bacterium]